MQQNTWQYNFHSSAVTHALKKSTHVNEENVFTHQRETGLLH